MGVRLKSILPTYRLHNGQVRIGAERSVTKVFEDPDGQLWTLIQYLDGREIPEIVSEVQKRYPSLSESQVHDGIRYLDQLGLLESSEAQTSDIDPTFDGTRNYLRYFERMDDAHRYTNALAEARVTLLGLGGGGSNIALQLVGCGIRHLTIVDYDKIEESNLGRQFLYHKSDVGKAKTEIAAQRLREHASDLDLEVVNAKILRSEQVIPLIENADLVISVIDEPEFDIYRIVNRANIELGKTCIYAASGTVSGRVFTIVLTKTGYFDCLNIYYSTIDDSFVEQFQAYHELHFNSPTIAYPPSIMFLTSVIVDEAVRQITGYMPSVSIGQQVEVDYLEHRLEVVTGWPRYEQKCPTCGNGQESDWPVFSQYLGEAKAIGLEIK